MTQEHLQEIVNQTCLINWGLAPYPTLEIKNVHRGKHRPKTNKITFPIWALSYNDAFQTYYAIHEACHHVTGKGHNIIFKSVEVKTLASFNIKPVYAKAYVIALYDLASKELWHAGETNQYQAA